MLTDDDIQSLCWLQGHWEGHYRIWLIESTWHARRQRHDQRTITAASAGELREKLKDDYADLAESERLVQPGRPTRGDQTSLNWLRMHYENNYQIDYVRPVSSAAYWQAESRADPPRTLVTDSALGLRDMMRDDQARRRSATQQALANLHGEALHGPPGSHDVAGG